MKVIQLILAVTLVGGTLTGAAQTTPLTAARVARSLGCVTVEDGGWVPTGVRDMALCRTGAGTSLVSTFASDRLRDEWVAGWLAEPGPRYCTTGSRWSLCS